MADRKNAFKALVIIALIGLVLVTAIGCQGGQTQSTANQAASGSSDQKAQVEGPKVLFFSADW